MLYVYEEQYNSYRSRAFRITVNNNFSQNLTTDFLFILVSTKLAVYQFIFKNFQFHNVLLIIGESGCRGHF